LRSHRETARMLSGLPSMVVSRSVISRQP
jgi:hypothetical protein